MILSTKGRYSVMAMVDLAIHAAGKPVGLAAIAERQEIPLAYLEQIFARLKKADVVKSVRGPGGGYLLATSPSELSIADIMLAADEPMKMTRCKTDSTKGCMNKKARCLTHDLWEGLSAQIRLYLGSIMLADVCGSKVQQKFPRAHANPELMRFAKEVISHQSSVSSKKEGSAEDWRLKTGDSL